MREITNDDLWSAFRGLKMATLSNADLRKLVVMHGGKTDPLFADLVIIKAAQQALTIRNMFGR